MAVKTGDRAPIPANSTTTRRAVDPATPVTAAQRRRHERILQVANALLSSGGEEALQMKEVALRADVALGTLYRYFPSKDHLLLAIALDRYEIALQKLQKTPARGETPGERVADYLLRQFRAEQREPLVTAATARVIHDTDRKYSYMLEQISEAQQKILRHVAQGDGDPVDPAAQRALVVVASCFGSATRGWLSGVRSSADARFEIKLACRLLDLPAEQLYADLDTATRASDAV